MTKAEVAPRPSMIKGPGDWEGEEAEWIGDGALVGSETPWTYKFEEHCRVCPTFLIFRIQWQVKGSE